ncbi:hypothetical protein HanXRQr2_Chr13g0612761 [Helianthus annuus]|uniref:Uncharacterized protein n=1 Tax=Helianthus annuus TaxID=4232 RepID=A0A9K3ELI6_HELAN|nr:hypothetical protein HanXRQr2_Chr13g0612761 [Helianthus annuus]KAJ0851254.1 hypothetical protein HanPSC8_Chr13g0590081 [Helianthus annuus]
MFERYAISFVLGTNFRRIIFRLIISFDCGKQCGVFRWIILRLWHNHPSVD